MKGRRAEGPKRPVRTHDECDTGSQRLGEIGENGSQGNFEGYEVPGLRRTGFDDCVRREDVERRVWSVVRVAGAVEEGRIH